MVFVSLLHSLCTIFTVTNSRSVCGCVGGTLLQLHVRAIRVGVNSIHTHGCTSTHISTNFQLLHVKMVYVVVSFTRETNS